MVAVLAALSTGTCLDFRCRFFFSFSDSAPADQEDGMGGLRDKGQRHQQQHLFDSQMSSGFREGGFVIIRPVSLRSCSAF